KDAKRLVVLEKKLTAVLEGDARPASNEERLQLANRVAWPKKLYAAAARLFAEALAEQPELGHDLRKGVRYVAASAAALAGCGQGEDAPRPDEKERSRLRQQARDWLKADLALLDEQAARGDPEMRERVKKRMRQWQTDSDLIGVRDAEGLARLPEEERKEWR